MIKKPYEQKTSFIDINIKNILCMLISFKLIIYPIKQKKKLFGLIKLIYMRTNLIIYVIVTDF